MRGLLGSQQGRLEFRHCSRPTWWCVATAGAESLLPALRADRTSEDETAAVLARRRAVMLDLSIMLGAGTREKEDQYKGRVLVLEKEEEN